MAYKFCPECGFKFDKVYKFCPDCGFKIGEQVQQNVDTIVDVQQTVDPIFVDQTVQTNEIDLSAFDSAFDSQIEKAQQQQKAHKTELEKANWHLTKGESQEALKLYEKLIDKDVDDIEAYIGVIKVKSQLFTQFLTDEVEKELAVTFDLFGESQLKQDSGMASYLQKRQELLSQKEKQQKREQEEFELKGEVSFMIAQQNERGDKSKNWGFFYLNKNKTVLQFGKRYFGASFFYQDLQREFSTDKPLLLKISDGLYMDVKGRLLSLVRSPKLPDNKNKNHSLITEGDLPNCKFQQVQNLIWELLYKKGDEIAFILGDKIVVDSITVHKIPHYGKSEEEKAKLPIEKIYNWVNGGVPGIAQDLRMSSFDGDKDQLIKKLYIPTKEELWQHRDKITPSGLLSQKYSFGVYGETTCDWLITMPNDGDCYYIVKESLDKTTPQEVDLVQIQNVHKDYGVINKKLGAKPILVLDATKLDGYYAEVDV